LSSIVIVAPFSESPATPKKENALLVGTPTAVKHLEVTGIPVALVLKQLPQPGRRKTKIVLRRRMV